MKPKIIFILDSISQPRCIKRINSFIHHGYDVEVYGFDREKYNQNAIIKEKIIKIIGKQDDGKGYFFKLFQTNKEIRNIIHIENLENKIFYSFGFLNTLFLKINGVKKYVYEISDILYGYRYFNSISWLLKVIDRFLIRNSILTVFTSEGFSKYLTKGMDLRNTIVQPNKLDSSFFKTHRPSCRLPINPRELVFSYIGAFRYPNTVFRFARIIGERYPKHEFHFYGESHLTTEVEKISACYENVRFFGSFKNPDDLHSIYQKIDIVIACYDSNNLNERLAEPNKLYEALYFKKPIIVSKNIFLEERVKKLGCGFSLDASKDENIISFLDSLSLDDLHKVYANIKIIGLEEIVDDNASKIISLIEKV